MNLIIENKHNLDADDFIVYLAKETGKWIIDNIDDRRAALWTKYLRDAGFKWNKIGKKTVIPSALDIIKGSVYHLTYTKFEDKYVIEISNIAMIPQTPYRYVELASLINYGNLSIPGYPLFDESFKYIEDNLGIYIKRYYKTGG